MYKILTQILNIPNYEVVGVETNDEQITLDIQSTMKGAKCPRCGKYSAELHENHPRIVRDLPICGKACYISKQRSFFQIFARLYQVGLITSPTIFYNGQPVGL